jgi:aspartate/methionine/tyrosine aminotransferase
VEIEEFRLERLQSLYENEVELNLSDSGVHPFDLRTLLDGEAREALLDVELGYGHTHGAPGLRRAIAGLYDDRDEDEILVTTGGVEANFLLVMTLVEPGDRIVVVTPNYLQISGWARAAGADVVEVPLDAERGWALDREALAAAMTPSTRLVTVCTPNNPTGTMLSEDDRAWLVGRVEALGAWLHADEVYAGSELDGDTPPSIADLTPRAIVTNSLSKAMALPGLRIGWLCGPRETIYAAWQRKDYTSITTSALSEAIAELALAPARRSAILERSRDWLRANRATLADWIAANPGFRCELPVAGGMALVAYDAPIGSDDLATCLREADGVLVVPGSCYGIEGHFRVGIGAPPAVLSAGLERIARRIAAL